jgi:hypothetical protein
MPRPISLNMRHALYAQDTSEVAVILVEIAHPSFEGGLVRLSTDPTERISDDPETWGTRHLGEVYYFVMLGAQLPDDIEDGPPETSLVFENITTDVIEQFRATRLRCEVTLKLVLASTPDVVEEEYTGLQGVNVQFSPDQVSLTLSREPFINEPWPCDRMTASTFPGLHR